jgi:hypothetical protein
LTLSFIDAHYRIRTLSEPAQPGEIGYDNAPPRVEAPPYRPLERFWPYLDIAEQPSDEEVAKLDPALAEALFGTPRRPFSVSLEFPVFDGPDYARAVAMARASAEYVERGSGAALRHRARFFPQDARGLRALFEIVGRLDACDVLIDDRSLPYARELWLPLVWFLIS